MAVKMHTGLQWFGLESRRKNNVNCVLHITPYVLKGARYFTDSLVNKIYAYDYDDGKLSNRRIAIDAIASGLPKESFCDGLCIDSEGYIWSARCV